MADWGPFDLTGKNAIVTGGAMGIGFGIASRLTEAGANVLVGDIDESAAKAAIEQLADHRGTAIAAQADVSDPTAGTQLAERCAAEFGSVDILANNAGIYPIVPFDDVTPEVFDRIVSVNYRGLLFTSQGVSRRMIQQGTGGAIVNIASIDGIHPSFPGLSTYGSSKAAVIQLTKNMAVELRRTRSACAPSPPGRSRPRARRASRSRARWTRPSARQLPTRWSRRCPSAAWQPRRHRQGRGVPVVVGRRLHDRRERARRRRVSPGR